MKIIKKNFIQFCVSIICNILILFSFNSLASTDNPFQVIYGVDNRYEVRNYPIAQFRTYAKSVVARVDKRNLYYNSDTNSYQFRSMLLLDVIVPSREFPNKRYCSNTKYNQQNILAECTGFLYQKDVIITAGHCAQSLYSCQNYYWVFDYVAGTKEIDAKNVFECKDLITSVQKNTNYKFIDYAIIKLSRPALDRIPLKTRTKGHLSLYTPLVMIGHPYGLPLKIADGATNRFMSTQEWKNPIRNWIKRINYFTANLDAFVGNSGSPVFNKKTGLVEGILTDGDDDEVFNSRKSCWEMKQKSNKTKNVIEQIFRITKVDFTLLN